MKPDRSADTTARVDRATSSAIARIARETGVARKEFARRLGRVGPATLAQVEDRVRILLDL